MSTDTAWLELTSYKTSIPGSAKPAVSAKMWLAVIGATLGAFMAVLNIQIVNASLADIQGAIGAGIDDGGWISTSYLIAEIVVIPLSGWLAQVFSVRSYLLANAALQTGQPLWAIAPGACIAVLGAAFALLNYAFDEIGNPALRPVRSMRGKRVQPSQ